MSEEKMMRLSQAARKLNVDLSVVVERLAKMGYYAEKKPHAKISIEAFNKLAKGFYSGF